MVSSQFKTGPGTHAPPEHASPLVQALLSVQLSVLAECWQPNALSQTSMVHALPSSHETPMPAMHVPPEHTSPKVHARPSSHAALLLACTQPVSGLQESLVQTSVSAQSRAPPSAQMPPEHASLVVQALPSEHGEVLSL